MRSRGRPPTITGIRRYPSRLKELRRHCGLSQQSVATRAGISIAYYGALERGDKRINADTAERLAGPLRCAIGDLLSGTQGVSVPLSLVIAAAESQTRLEHFEMPEPHERLRPGRLTAAEDCFAAEILDDCADIDFARGTILIAREREQLHMSLCAGDKVVARFFLEPAANGGARATHEILYGILDQTIVGDLVLITRTRNRLIPRNLLIQSAPPERSDLARRGISPPARDAGIVYEPRPDDPAEILGAVVYAMGPI
jgi:transcriptional regulator with XRE-family HTH domain